MLMKNDHIQMIDSDVCFTLFIVRRRKERVSEKR